jgi:hypothetical protein
MVGARPESPRRKNRAAVDTQFPRAKLQGKSPRLGIEGRSFQVTHPVTRAFHAPPRLSYFQVTHAVTWKLRPGLGKHKV